MFFVLSKILSFLIQPLLWGVLFLILSLFAKSEKKRRKRILTSLIILFLFSNQAIFHEVTNAWEMEPVQLRDFKEHYEVAVVLGGIVSMDREHKIVEFQSNSDRFLNVLPLYFNGQVEKILIAGGTGRVFGEEKEATILQNYLIKIGVSYEDIIVETQSRNTFENAKNSADILKEMGIKGKILLSTSSTHMYRSAICFKKQGIEFDVFPVDQVSYKRELTLDRILIPHAKTLDRWNGLIHEWVGILVYKLKGYC